MTRFTVFGISFVEMPRVIRKTFFYCLFEIDRFVVPERFPLCARPMLTVSRWSRNFVFRLLALPPGIQRSERGTHCLRIGITAHISDRAGIFMVLVSQPDDCSWMRKIVGQLRARKMTVVRSVSLLLSSRADWNAKRRIASRNGKRLRNISSRWLYFHSDFLLTVHGPRIVCENSLVTRLEDGSCAWTVTTLITLSRSC